VIASTVGLAFVGLLAYFARRKASGSSPARSPLAHRVDGTDDSRSFAAGIADEGTIPDVDPLAAPAPAV
jgi:hypothetical protein